MNVNEPSHKIRQRDQMSPTQLSRDLRRETFTSPQFVYPLAIGAGMGVSAWALGMGVIGWTLLALGVGAILGSGGWATLRQLLWRDQLVYRRMIQLQTNMQNEIRLKQDILRDNLGSLEDRRAAEQLENLSAKFELVKKRLSERFDPSEITYIRYVGTAEQVYLGGLDNLRAVVESSEALRTMDKVQLKARCEALAGNGQVGEARLIQERIEMIDRYQKRIQDSLSDNEAAITRLSQVLEALDNLNTGQGMARAPLDQAMEELSRLAERTDEYGI